MTLPTRDFCNGVLSSFRRTRVFTFSSSLQSKHLFLLKVLGGAANAGISKAWIQVYFSGNDKNIQLRSVLG